MWTHNTIKLQTDQIMYYGNQILLNTFFYKYLYNYHILYDPDRDQTSNVHHTDVCTKWGSNPPRPKAQRAQLLYQLSYEGCQLLLDHESNKCVE